MRVLIKKTQDAVLAQIEPPCSIVIEQSRQAVQAGKANHSTQQLPVRRPDHPEHRNPPATQFRGMRTGSSKGDKFGPASNGGLIVW
ncbi:hypothetical protein D3C84_946760 [compost metagenome]